jgi:hypothetical protein
MLRIVKEFVPRDSSTRIYGGMMMMMMIQT